LQPIDIKPNEEQKMTENTKEESQSEDVKLEEKTDTVSKLFEERDSESRDPSKIEERKGGITPEKAPEKTKGSDTPSQKLPDKPIEDKADLSEKLKVDPLLKPEALEKPLKEEDDPPSELEALHKKLEKTEKVLAENHKYGRSNAQKVKNAVKAVQRFADDGLLAEEEAKELLGTLYSEGEEAEDEDASRFQASPFVSIFKVANKELENILKYTDDPHLQDKVNAFDYFLSVGSKEEIEQVLEDLTDLLDDPLKLARKMLAIGQDVYEESYKGIKAAGGFKNYLSVKDQEIEKLQKKLDKLEKKLLQYEDFDKPRYRIDETGSPGMGDVDGSKPANDTISTLFDERDKVGVDLRPRGK
jgi:hypothetical protein